MCVSKIARKGVNGVAFKVVMVGQSEWRRGVDDSVGATCGSTSNTLLLAVFHAVTMTGQQCMPVFHVDIWTNLAD